MFRLRQFIRRFQPAGTDSASEPSVQQSPGDRERITRVVIERLSEDETLRGHLTDAGFGPILMFVTSLVPAAAARATELSSAQAVEDEVSRTARALTRAIVAAAETGDAAALRDYLVTPMLSSDEAMRAQQAVSNAIDNDVPSDARAVRTIDILTSAIREQGA